MKKKNTMVAHIGVPSSNHQLGITTTLSSLHAEHPVAVLLIDTKIVFVKCRSSGEARQVKNIVPQKYCWLVELFFLRFIVKLLLLSHVTCKLGATGHQFSWGQRDNFVVVRALSCLALQNGLDFMLILCGLIFVQQDHFL